MTTDPTDEDAQPRRIVVGYDGSQDSDPALLFAAREALMRGVELRVVCSYDLSSLAFSPAGSVTSDAWQVMSVAARSDIERATETVRTEVGADVKVTGSAIPGRPSQVLEEQSVGAEMLVVGSRRLGGLGRLFLGSTSTELIHHATVPVVVVPSARMHPSKSRGDDR